jgi:hypothetical protein
VSLPGRRVHITGSAAPDCRADSLKRAQDYVGCLTSRLIENGAGLVLGAGAEPTGTAGLPCTFDWTVLEHVAAAPVPALRWPPARPRRFVVVASQHGLECIPANRAATWQRCCERPDLELVTAPPGWRMAGIIREQQVADGDVLLVLGGGAGAEHLAQLYSQDGKSVVPIWVDLGALHRDGRGGSRALHERALAEPEGFFALASGTGSAAARLQSSRLGEATDPATLATNTVSLLGDLAPPSAFFVRLLDNRDPQYPAVETFFRDVVEPVVTERGFSAFEMGAGRPHAAFMNVEIFTQLHRAGLVVVDLTGMRPNCTMELGYALGRPRRVVISARIGTTLAFDVDKLPTHFWDDDGALTERRANYLAWLDRHIDLPPLVQ